MYYDGLCTAKLRATCYVLEDQERLDYVSIG